MVKLNMKSFSELNYKKIIKFMGITGVLLFFGIFGGFHYFNKMMGLADDNEVETQIENIIEHQTGLVLDLTPED